MQKFNTFKYAFKRSLTDFSYYLEVLKTPFWFSLKYLVLLIFTFIFIQTVFFTVQAALYLPKLPGLLDQIQNRLEAAYPDDLVIMVKNGALTINQPTPYYIDIPEMSEVDGYTHLITIDPEAEVSDFEESRSIVLVTDREIVYPDQQNGSTITSYRVMSLREFPEDVVLDERQYQSFISKLEPIFAWIPRIAPFLLLAGVILIPFFGTLLSTAWQLMYLLFLTGIVFLISKVFHLNISFGKLYQLSMHGLTIPLALSFLMTMLGVYIPLVFTSSFLLWMVIIISKLEKR